MLLSRYAAHVLKTKKLKKLGEKLGIVTVTVTNGTAVVFMGVMAILLRSGWRVLGRAAW